MINTVESLAQAIGMTRIPQSWTDYYDSAMDAMPGEIAWITDDFMATALSYYKLDGDSKFSDMIYSALRRIRDNEALRQVAHLSHYLMINQPDLLVREGWGWETPEGMVSLTGNMMLPTVVLLSGMEKHKENMHLRGYDEYQVEQHILGVNDACYKDMVDYGMDGLRFTRMTWGIYFTVCCIIQVGRLQYEISVFNDNVRMYRDEEGSCVIMLDSGVRVTADGNVLRPTDMESEYAWESVLTVDGDSVTGHISRPDGVIETTATTLSLVKWREVLKKGDPCISMHIEVGKKFDDSLVQDSLKRAEGEVRKYFAKELEGVKDLAYTCHSWLISDMLPHFLPGGGNIVDFLNNYYYYRVPQGGGGYFTFLFVASPGQREIASLREDTSLQRRVKQHLMEGKPLRDGAGIILAADAGKGSGYYKKTFKF